MVKGIGIDMCSIERIKKIASKHSFEAPFFVRTFSEAEKAEAEVRSDKASFFAARFAAKEAVLKALAPLTETGSMDLRVVETLHDNKGAPYVVKNEALSSIMQNTGVTAIHISITTEAGIAAAFVVAEG